MAQPPDGVAFREAQLADVGDLVALLVAVVGKRPEYISHGELHMGVADRPGELAPRAAAVWHDEVTAAVSSPLHHVLVAVRGRDLIGFCLAELTRREPLAAFGTITDLGVRPEQRRSGVGSRLFDASVAWLTAQGAESIFLESGLGNDDAHEFFERRGFRPISKVFWRPPA